MYDQCGRIDHCPFLEIDTRTAAPVFHPTAHTHPSFRTERADFFFPLRSCEVVGLCREKSLFLAGGRAVIPKTPLGGPSLRVLHSQRTTAEPSQADPGCIIFIGKHVILWSFRAMTIHLTPEQEKIVKEELESGHFRMAEELISQALCALRATTASSGKSGNNGSHRKAVREMMEFVEKNRTSLHGVSVKELIHEGHRL